MKKLIIFCLAAFAAASAFVACNSSDTSGHDDTQATCVALYSFALSADKDVLANLDTVFFSINLNSGEIFNADSLPAGTPINKLVPRMRVLESVSRLEITETRADGTDTVHNYLTNATDTIDFSNGPVKITIVSPDGMTSKNYYARVNVHTLKPDSLVWAETARRDLPSSFAAPTAQRTARMADALYCLSTDGTAYCLASTTDPAADSWQTASCTLPAGARIETFSASSEALYIIAGGKLYTSADGSGWTDTGRTWSHIYGGYEASVLGLCADGATIEQYPGGSTFSRPADMPVSATSQPVTQTFPIADQPQFCFVGGVKADGTLSTGTWAFDGRAFMNIATKPMPVALRDLTLVPFYFFTTNSLFISTCRGLYLAFGGSDGTSNNAIVYASNDYGMTWAKASELMQLPAYVPAMAQAQAYVFDSTLTPARSASPWTLFETAYRLSPASRATAPVESWQCPYIYLFGGVDADGKLYNTVWRATLNRLTFIPIQ